MYSQKHIKHEYNCQKHDWHYSGPLIAAQAQAFNQFLGSAMNNIIGRCFTPIQHSTHTFAKPLQDIHSGQLFLGPSGNIFYWKLRNINRSHSYHIWVFHALARSTSWFWILIFDRHFISEFNSSRLTLSSKWQSGSSTSLGNGIKSFWKRLFSRVWDQSFETANHTKTSNLHELEDPRDGPDSEATRREQSNIHKFSLVKLPQSNK